MRLPFLKIVTVIFALFFAGETWAHPGHAHPSPEVDEFETGPAVSAAGHPFSGFDHLLAMLVVGALVAGGMRGLGVVFAGAVGLGFPAALVLPPWLPGLLLVMAGVVIWNRPPSTKGWVWGAVLMAGILQGGAHAEGMIGLASGVGLCAGTLAGVGLGAAVAAALRSLPPVRSRFSGASMALAGLLLTLIRL